MKNNFLAAGCTRPGLWRVLGVAVVICLLYLVHYNMTEMRHLVNNMHQMQDAIVYSANRHEQDHHEPDASGSPTLPEIVLLFCLDWKQKDGMATSLDRQMRQITVLLKSVAALTSTRIRVSLVTDSVATHHMIVNVTSTWPLTYRNRLIFSPQRPAHFPTGTHHLQKIWRICSSGKLFLPQMLPEKDVVMYLDTDTVFMRPPEELWTKLFKFGPQQLMGISPCLYLYNSLSRFPIYGESGINSGVLLMNLTRLRQYPGWDGKGADARLYDEDGVEVVGGGWIQTVVEVQRQYEKYIKLPDQDMLNIIFSGTRQPTMYEVGCEWNFRFNMCNKKVQNCVGAAERGVALLHGCEMSFINENREKKIKSVFEAWEQYELGQPLSVLVELIEDSLRRVGNKSKCGKVEGIDDILLKGLKETVQTLS